MDITHTFHCRCHFWMGGGFIPINRIGNIWNNPLSDRSVAREKHSR